MNAIDVDKLKSLIENDKPLQLIDIREDYELQTEGTLNMIANGSQFLLIDLGWPMIVGSIIFAVPGFIISYFLTYRIVSSHRKIKARLAGMGYNEWRAKYETKS